MTEFSTKLKRIMFQLNLLCLMVLLFSACKEKSHSEENNTVEDKKKHPNIVLILADDLGYGDPQVYNPNSKIPTPNIDKMANEGMLFTDAHTNSSVCTPTRYGIITGQYSWRSSLKNGVTWSYDPLIIDTTSTTIASLLKANGYNTAAVGKWHIGLDWQKSENDSVLFNKELRKSPINLGFNYFYGIAASLDIPPYVYIENNKVVEQPNGFSQGTSPTYKDDFWRKGPVSPDFDHYDVLNNFTEKAIAVIKEQKEKDNPFFVYLPLTAPHLPWIPKDGFKGKSEAGNYGDLTAEVDDVVGRINKVLKELNLEEETLVIFTSDNGSQFSSENMAKYNHKANDQWRGRKGDIYEGGHRVPFIVKWPAKIKANQKSDQLVSTTDFLATFAELVGAEVPTNEIKDSESFLPVLLGNSEGKDLRNTMVYHSAKGMFAIRDNNWVLVDGKGSGGFLEAPDTTQIEKGKQLYNLEKDPSQQTNEYENKEAVEKSLLEKLNAIKNATK
ncbi:sulfatase family protein [Galbibacter mesophilus]|uniref:sulfatase family protein n=1 Tax=Galbibacter mesophilus TaxID=379069 RepID=UPI00191D826D|nr:arylsulfatase [Galbibacter mesophilus]MCM5663899.1 arylsulfatase [Galbibacter mesophilus]